MWGRSYGGVQIKFTTNKSETHIMVRSGLFPVPNSTAHNIKYIIVISGWAHGTVLPAPEPLSPHLQALTTRSQRSYRPINMNHYATKKTAAQSMLDVALLMANSSQLKTVIYVGPRYRFYIPLIVLLSLSITLQVVVGLLLVFIGKWHVVVVFYWL